MSNRAWVTLATNDSYGLGALVLAHSLRRAGSVYPAVVLITPSVTEAMSDRLRAVYTDVVTVDVLDSRDAAHLALLQRPELGITFTKIHCWSLTQYEKCVFLDADTLVIQNCDELFEREELSAAPDVGWPDCFNSGVFVFRPSADTFNELIKFAQERGSFDGGDQGLLNSFFSDWAHGDINKHLPFLYNVTSAAFYSYLPALKHYGQNLKIIHFIGAVKPWLQQYNWETRAVGAPDHLRELLQLWWDIFVSQVHCQLDTTMVEVQDAPPAIPPQDVNQYFHYQPIVDPESEFPWHHPDAQTQEETSEQAIDMTQIHNPWDIYRGHIPPSRDDNASHYSEMERVQDHEQIRKYAWDYQGQDHSDFNVQQAHEHNVNHQECSHQHYGHSVHDNYEQHEHKDHTHYEHHEHHWQHDQETHAHTYDDNPQSYYGQSHEHWHHEQPKQDQHHDYHQFNQDTHTHEHKQDHEDGLPHHSHDSHNDHSSQMQHNHHSHDYTSHIHIDPVNKTHTHYEFKEHSHKHIQNLTQDVGVYHVQLDHDRINDRRRSIEQIETDKKTEEMNGDISDIDSEIYEELVPRHPYDGFYLRHRVTIDSYGRKICSHEIPPSPSLSPSESPLPDDNIQLEEEQTIPNNISDCEDHTGVAGNLARVVPGSGFQREALDELTRRQGWEAGNIDYMGADSFDNIWAKISQTLSQPRTSPAKQTPPTEVAPPQPVVQPVEVAKVAVPGEAPVIEAPAVVEAPAPVESAVPIETPATVEEPVSVAVTADETAAAPEVPTPVPTPVVALVRSEVPAPIPTPVEIPACVEEAIRAEVPAPVEIPKTVEAIIESSPKTSETPKESKDESDSVKPSQIPPSDVSTPSAVKTPQEAAPTSPIVEVKQVAETTKAAPSSPAPATEAPASPAIPEQKGTPEKPAATAVATDSPPLANTPSKEEAPAVPAAKSAERRKPAGKLQLRPPAAADPLPTPDSEVEDAASLAQSIIASELRTPTVTAPEPATATVPCPAVGVATPTSPASAPAPAQEKRLSVEKPEVPTPPVGAVSLAQIGVKPSPKGKASTAAQIESSVSPQSPTEPSGPGSAAAAPAEVPKKKVIKKVVKKEVATSGEAPVPPPRKKEKKPKEK